jgi:hypothetical protein
MLRRGGDAAGADAAYARAISLTDNAQEREALERRRLDQSSRSGRPKRSNAARIFDGSSRGCSG